MFFPGGLCPEVSLSRDVFLRGSLSRGVSVQGESLSREAVSVWEEGLCPGSRVSVQQVSQQRPQHPLESERQTVHILLECCLVIVCVAELPNIVKVSSQKCPGFRPQSNHSYVILFSSLPSNLTEQWGILFVCDSS